MNRLYEIASEVCKNHMNEVKSAIKRVIELDYVGRKQGLFEMESYVFNEEPYEEKDFVDLIVGYIVDARDWELIDGFLTSRILMMDNDKKRYLCYFYKECLKLISSGKFMFFSRECISSFFPEKYQDEILNYIDEIEEIIYKMELIDM